MIRPFEIFYFIVEFAVIVESIADIQNKIVAFVLGLKIISDILNVVPVYFLDHLSGRKGHGNQSLWDIGKIKFLALKLYHSLWTSHKLFDHLRHKHKYNWQLT